ncbi:MAG: HemK2/MTQ2 family protein methyltransferase [Actinocatenispora sp.]
MMRLFSMPGVYAPQRDTVLLARALLSESLPSNAHVLDIGTGTGVLALLAAQHGADRVTAVDASGRAVLTARINARLRGLSVDVRHGDLFTAVPDGRFHLILANPPYVPAPATHRPSRRSDARWDAGADGRRVIDRLCTEVADRLGPGGVFLMVQSGVCGVAASLARLSDSGMDADVISRIHQPFGPVLRRRADWLAARGRIPVGDVHDELVVIRAQHTR